MKIEITFGMALDGVRDLNRSLGQGCAALNQIVCGPLSLLQLLETRLGLGGVEASMSDRIRMYLKKVQLANAAWCRKSFERDQWGASARLLSLRDELVMMGCRLDSVQSDPSTRLGALALIERTGEQIHVPSSLADRLWAVARSHRCIEEELNPTFVDNPSFYPAVWKEIFRRHLGTAIADHVPVVFEPIDKGTGPDLTIVRAPDEARLAVELARYLKAGTAESNRDVAIVAEGDTTLLDGVLTRYGLPRIGRSSSSIYREVLEIVPLWIELMWQPFKPELLIALLGMPLGPMGRGLSRILIRALNEAPGIGGDCWENAWEEIFKHVENENPSKRVELAEWKRILEVERFPIEDGIPIPNLQTVMLAVRKRFTNFRARLMDQNKSAPVKDERVVGLSVAIEQVKQLENAVKMCGTERISRAQLVRIVESVTGCGLGRYDAHEEVADYLVVRNSGQITKPTKTVIWWDFTDPGVARRTNWLESELVGLPGRYDACMKRQMDLASWGNARAMAKEHFICFVPERKAGEIVAPHPYFDNLVVIEGGKEEIAKHTYACGASSQGGSMTLADRAIDLVASDAAFEPIRSNPMTVPSDPSLNPEKLSPSQLEKLIECPYAWYLKNHIKLKDADLNDVLVDSLIKGKLAHKVMELLFTEVKPSSPSDAAIEAGRLFDILVPQMAAMFDAIEKREARRQFKSSLCLSVESFFIAMEERNLEFESCETSLTTLYPKKEENPDKVSMCVPFEGRLDLVLHDKTDPTKKFIVDYKWAKHPENYTNAVKAGKSLQLAAYDWLLSDGAFGISSGYYIFPKELLFDNKQADGRGQQNDAETWGRACAFYDKVLPEMREGVVRKGVPDAVFEKFRGRKKAGESCSERDAERAKFLNNTGVDPSRMLDKSPNCQYCPYRTLCGEVVQLEPQHESTEVVGHE